MTVAILSETTIISIPALHWNVYGKMSATAVMDVSLTSSAKVFGYYGDSMRLSCRH